MAFETSCQHPYGMHQGPPEIALVTAVTAVSKYQVAVFVPASGTETSQWGSETHPTSYVKLVTSNESDNQSNGYNFAIAQEDIAAGARGKVVFRGPTKAIASNASIDNGEYVCASGVGGQFGNMKPVATTERRLGLYFGPTTTEGQIINIIFEGIESGFGIEP